MTRGQPFGLGKITGKVEKEELNINLLILTFFWRKKKKRFLNSSEELEKSVQQIITTWRNPSKEPMTTVSCGGIDYNIRNSAVSGLGCPAVKINKLKLTGLEYLNPIAGFFSISAGSRMLA